MTKDDIIMDWLGSAANRSQLTTLLLEKQAFDVVVSYGDTYRTGDAVVYCIGHHLYILKVIETDAEIMK